MNISKPFAAAFAIALIVIAFLVWRGFVETKGNHLAPDGKIGKVRVQKVDENESVMVLDFNLRNASDRPMIVRSVEVILDEADGSTATGSPVAAADLANVFRNYPGLGEQYNAPLKARDKVPPRDSLDRMVGVRFDLPDAAIEKRKGVTLKIEDITGPVAELRTK
jgi:hypothetical protein